LVVIVAIYTTYNINNMHVFDFNMTAEQTY